MVAKAGKFLMSIRNELRRIVGKNVVIKYTPELNFVYDPSVERGMKILEALDELEQQEREEFEKSQLDCDGSQHANDSNE